VSSAAPSDLGNLIAIIPTLKLKRWTIFKNPTGTKAQSHRSLTQIFSKQARMESEDSLLGMMNRLSLRDHFPAIATASEPNTRREEFINAKEPNRSPLKGILLCSLVDSLAVTH
jgi:hypothetical protein